MPGAEGLSTAGGEMGVLVLHGFTGSPSSVRALAEAFAAHGHSVEVPRLPGHGTCIDDMMRTSWADWSAAAEAALDRLRQRTERQVVAGLSMGGSLACWLAVRHPGIAGLICINPAVTAQDGSAELVRSLVDAGETVVVGSGSDIADPDATDLAYRDTPLVPLLSMLEAASEFAGQLDLIEQPMLLINSIQDHVVPPSDSDHLAAAVSGTVERLQLQHSYHVATVDLDRELVMRRSVEFVDRLAASARH